MADSTQEQRRKRHFNRKHDLKTEYVSYWKPTHMEIADNLYPQGARFISEEGYPNDGKRRDSKIFNSTPVMAHRALVAGIFSGVTSPVNKWARYTIDDQDLKENAEVKEYFDTVTDVILGLLSKSNFYTSAESFYSILTAFATGGVQIDPDLDTVFRFTPFTIGSFYIDTDARGLVDTVYREFNMRARNVIEKFGEENVSTRVKEATGTSKTGNTWIKVLHVQEKNVDRDVTKLDAKNKEWSSTYYEADSKENEKPLRESGYDTMPFAVSRYSVIGDERYGRGPGEVSLGDNKQLQSMTEDYGKAVKKKVGNPIVVNGAENDITVDASANGITYTGKAISGGGRIVEPLYSPDIDLNDLRLLIIDTQNRIEQAFFSNALFLLSSQAQTGAKTATEVIAIQRELLRLFGPLMERLNPEFLRPVLARCYDLANKAGRLPPPPEIIQGMDIKIDIITEIGQAQLATRISPIEQTIAAAAQMSERWPQVLDKIDPDQALDEIGDAVGVQSGIIKSDEVVAKERAIANEELLRQQELQETQQAIQGAKDLSQTDTSGDNALTAVAGGTR